MGDGNQQLLGRVAIAANLITVEQLNEAVRKYGERDDGVRLGDLMVQLGMLDENRSLILDDLRKNHDQIAGLKKHLADTKDEISRLQGH